MAILILLRYLYLSTSLPRKCSGARHGDQGKVTSWRKWWTRAWERKVQLWNACVETASEGLRAVSHSVEIRIWHTGCALVTGDVENTVGNFDVSSFMSIFMKDGFYDAFGLLLLAVYLAYYHHPIYSEYHIFFLQSSPASMSTLKRCLHYDPDSKISLTGQIPQ